MAVRFVIGLAGTGKTSHCAEALMRASLQQPLGPPLLWLVPEQATFISEQRLLAAAHLRGTFRVQVLGFKRFCRMMALELGMESTMDLSGITRTLLLAQAVEQCRPQLELFAGVAHQPGFLRSLDGILRELQQAGHDATSLDTVRKALARSGAAQSVLDRKLHDFSILLTAWQKRLGTHQYDPDRLPQLLADRLAESSTIAGTQIWLDSFSALSLVEMNLITALARYSAGLEITLLADPTSAVFTSDQAPLSPLSTFHRTETLYRRLRSTLAKARIPIEPTLFLHQAQRFAHAPALQRAAQLLFSRTTSPAISASAPVSESDRVVPSTDPPDDVISIWECATPEAEIRAAAEHIRMLVRSTKCRYRDIGIVVADMEAYEPALRRIFEAYEIPHFMDRRRPLSHHPLVELLRMAVRLVLNGYRQADWLALLKTGLTGLTDNETFLLENYLLTHGIDHDDFSQPWQWASTDPDEDDRSAALAPDEFDKKILIQANAIREKIRRSFALWWAAAQPHHGAAPPAQALLNLLGDLQVRSTMQRWIDQATNQGHPELALIHEQAWQEVLNLLEVMQQLTAQTTGSLADFAALLGDGLETLTLGLIPPALDQVLVSSPNRSRHPELHTVLILGSVETRFPMVLPEDPMLDDRQRELFNQASISPIGGGRRLDFLEAPFFDYVAFTRAARRLVVSYPTADSAGTEVKPSRYVHQLRASLPSTALRRVSCDHQNLTGWACRDDALTGLMRWIRSAEPPTASFAATVAPMTPEQGLELYHWLTVEADELTRHAAHQALTALQPRHHPQLSPATIGRGHHDVLRMSASQLESFCRCPQQYFFAHTLRLQQRQTPEVDAPALGLLYHQALQGVFGQIIAGNIPWPGCSRDQLLALLEQQIDLAFVTLETRLFAPSPQTKALRRPVRRNLQALLTKEWLAAQTSPLRPRRVEAVFGTSPYTVLDDDRPPLPPLQLSSAGGIRVEISGKIDRLDADEQGRAVVIDYKSGHAKFSLHYLQAGIRLQLPLYLLVLRQPAAQFDGNQYHGLAAFYQTLQFKPSDKTPVAPLQIDNPSRYASLKPSGFFRLEHFALLEPLPEPQQSAQWYNLKINKDGSPRKDSKDAISSVEFDQRLETAENLIVGVADSIAHGWIRPQPFRDGTVTACTHCAFKAACPFDQRIGPYRIIKKQPDPPGPPATPPNPADAQPDGDNV